MAVPCSVWLRSVPGSHAPPLLWFNEMVATLFLFCAGRNLHQGFSIDIQYAKEKCVEGRHLEANFATTGFKKSIIERWPPAGYKFRMIFFDWFFLFDRYLRDLAGGSYHTFTQTNIPMLVRKYGTEAVFLPIFGALVEALKSDDAIKALDECGLTRRVLIKDAVTNPLYVASTMCEDLINEDAPQGDRKYPKQELERVVGRDSEFWFIVLQKENSKYGVDLSNAVPKPR